MNPQSPPIIHIHYSQNMDTSPHPIINVHYPQNTTTHTLCPTCGSQVQEGDKDEDGRSENTDEGTEDTDAGTEITEGGIPKREDVGLLDLLALLGLLPMMGGILILVLKFIAFISNSILQFLDV